MKFDTNGEAAINREEDFVISYDNTPSLEIVVTNYDIFFLYLISKLDGARPR